MSDQTNIEWCDSTFNPWMGCTKVSPACDHCYAERDTKRFGRVEWGAGKPRVRTSAANWRQPERWERRSDVFRECGGCGWRGEIEVGDEAPIAFACPSCDRTHWKPARRRVFCASLADWLDNEAQTEWWLADLLDLIRRTPNLDWLLLTKRIGNWRNNLGNALSIARADGKTDTADMIERWLGGEPPANVWIGSTVINQAEADRDVPKLLAVPARVRFLSIEPMLGAIDLRAPLNDMGEPRYSYLERVDECDPRSRGLDWIICGGESGPHARPMHPDWVRSLRDQCASAGVPFLFKQWGEWEPRELWSSHLGGGRFEPMTAIMLDGSTCPPDLVPQDVGAHRLARVGKARAGRQLNGREHSEWPA